MMDFRDMHYFVVIGEMGSLAKAADQVGRTQPALTRCIQRLEEELQIKLFQLDGRRHVLTEAGKVFLVRSKSLLAHAKEIHREVQDIASGAIGTIRIGCAATPAEHMMPSISAEMIRRAPGVTFKLVLGMNDVLFSALDAKELDLVFGPITQAILNDDRYVIHSLAEDTVVVAASPKHPIFKEKISIQSISRYKWVLPRQLVATRQWLDQKFGELGQGIPEMQMETSSMSLLPRLIEETQLLSFISRRNLEPGAAGGLLREVKLKELEMKRDFGLIHLDDAYLTPAAELFLQIARNNKN
jgi:DNA-binding transcriptional LysR family regulator